MPFTRRLDDSFIEELNRVYQSPEGRWWRRLVDSPKDVFVAIRNNALNAYARGGSIARVEWTGRRIRVWAHEEYLSRPSGILYVEIGAEPERHRAVVADFEAFGRDFESIVKRIGLFSGYERAGTNRIACGQLSVIDMEAAHSDEDDLALADEFSRHLARLDPEAPQKHRAGRFDLVRVNAKGQLIVVETKEYLNVELWKKGGQPVVEQLGQYHRWLVRNQEAFRVGYDNVLSIASRLHGDAFARVGNTAGDPTKLSVDVVPRLLIFGYDGDQEVSARSLRKDIARNAVPTIPDFTEDHVRTVGDPTNVKSHHLV